VTTDKNRPETYYDSYSSAVTAVYEYVEDNGYKVDNDDWFNQVTLGGKPKAGETKTSHGIGLSKNGKELRKCLRIDVYRIQMPDYTNDRFELNWYIS
jgi:hypothetical protein